MGIMSLDKTIEYAKEHMYEQSVIEHLQNYKKYLEDRILELENEKQKCVNDLMVCECMKNWKVKING